MIIVVRRQPSCWRVVFEVKKERSIEQKRWKKKAVHPHFPSFSQPLCLSVNLLPLEETQRLLRRKGPESPRLPHTDLFTRAGQWGHRPNVHPPQISMSLCACVCVIVAIYTFNLIKNGIGKWSKITVYWKIHSFCFPKSTYDLKWKKRQTIRSTKRVLWKMVGLHKLLVYEH